MRLNFTTVGNALRNHAWLVAILLGALLLRYLLLFHTVFGHQAVIYDEAEFVRMFENFRNQGVFFLNIPGYDVRDYYTLKSVGYPIVLWLVSLVTDNFEVAARRLNVAASLASTILVYSLAGRLFSGLAFARARQILVALLFALWPVLIYLNFQLLGENICILLTLGAFYALSCERPVIAGTLLGAACFFRPEVQMLAALIAFWFILKKQFRHSFLIFSFMLLMITPWLVRNAIWYGGFQMVSSFGQNFYIGNNADKMVTTMQRYRPEQIPHYLSGLEVNLRPVMRNITEFEESRLLTGLGWRWVKNNPGDAIIHGFRKVMETWCSEWNVFYFADPGRWANIQKGNRWYYKWSITIPYAILLTSFLFCLFLTRVPGYYFAYPLVISVMSFVLNGEARFHIQVIPYMMLMIFASQLRGSFAEFLLRRWSFRSQKGSQNPQGSEAA